MSEGETWVRLGDLVESDENEREIGDISSFAETIDPDDFNSALTVWDCGDYYVIVDGHRRFRALRYHGVGDDYPVPAIVNEYENDREALLDNIQSDENREDLTAMEQARKWSRYVLVEHNGEEMTYFEYVSELSERVQKDSLHIPSQDHASVEDLTESIDLGSRTIRNRLMYLLYPESVRESIEKGFLKQTVARTIPPRCTSVEDPEKALELIAELGEYFEGKGGIDSEKRDIINWSIEQANETGEVSVRTEPMPEPEQDEPDESDEPEDVPSRESDQSDESDEPEESTESDTETDETSSYEPEDDSPIEQAKAIIGQQIDRMMHRDKMASYAIKNGLTVDDVREAYEECEDGNDSSLLNQMHIRAENEEKIRNGPEYRAMQNSKESKEPDEPESEVSEEQDTDESESETDESDEQRSWTDSVEEEESDESEETDFAGTEPGEFRDENSTPEETFPDTVSDSSDDSRGESMPLDESPVKDQYEETEGFVATEVGNGKFLVEYDFDDTNLGKSLDPEDIEFSDWFVEKVSDVEKWKRNPIVQAEGPEAVESMIREKMKMDQVEEEWESDEFVSAYLAHAPSFRFLRKTFERSPEHLCCPDCGSGSTHLEFGCCGVTIGEALEKHATQYVEDKNKADERMTDIQDEILNGEVVESEVSE